MTVISPEQLKVITISLWVNAPELYELHYPPTLEEINRLCSLSDVKENESLTGTRKLEHFETEVNRDQWIEWVGKNKSSDENYTIEIESIVYDHNKKSDIEASGRLNFFDQIAHCSENGKTVKRKVESDIQKGPIWHHYWINFRIIKSDEGYKNYSIDPRLKIK